MTDDTGSESAAGRPDQPAARFAVAVPIDDQDVELIADELFQLGATAVSELPERSGRLRLVADLTVEGLDRVRAAGRDAQVLEPDRSWTEGWRDHARIWRCGRGVVLRPAWIAPEPLAPDDVEIVIEPGGAFGSGSHETTRLCVAAVEQLVEPGCSVLDVGCGSGVLGVAAARLGAARVVGIDIDPEAVRATRALAGTNGVGATVAASDTPLADVDSDFDLVVANLLAPIIEELAPVLAARVGPSGVLVLSGLLVDHVERVRSCFPEWSLRATEPDAGWVALQLRRVAGIPTSARR